MGISPETISWMPTITPGKKSNAMATGVAPAVGVTLSLPVGASFGLGAGGASVPVVPVYERRYFAVTLKKSPENF